MPGKSLYARYHHSKRVQAFLKEHTGNIMMVFLPAYTPEYNPDEQVWNHAKRQLSQKPITNKGFHVILSGHEAYIILHSAFDSKEGQINQKLLWYAGYKICPRLRLLDHAITFATTDSDDLFLMAF